MHAVTMERKYAARMTFEAADTHWGDALRRAYGRKAGDARFDARGVATDELRQLKEERDRCMAAWHDACDLGRGQLG